MTSSSKLCKECLSKNGWTFIRRIRSRSEVLLKDDLICEKSPVRVADMTIDEVTAKKFIVAEVTILVLR